MGVVEVMPEISVIVPVYNVEKYVGRCIDSILNQTFTDFELILVNDGSTDNSGVLCDKYAKSDDRIKVIHKENGGLSDARNCGIDESLGEYLSFIDSDDWVENNFLKTLYDNAIKHKAEIVIVNLHKVLDDKHEQSVPINEMCCSGREALNYLYGEQSIYTNVAWNKLYKKSLFKNIRYPVGRTHEDGFTTYMLLDLCNNVYFSNYDAYCYYQRSDSIMNSMFTQNRIDEYFVYCERRKYFEKNNLEELFIENERTILACIKSLTIKIYESDWNQKLKRKYYRIFEKDVRENYKNIRTIFSRKQKAQNDIYILSAYLYAILNRVKSRIWVLLKKYRNLKIWTSFRLKSGLAKILHKNGFAFYMMSPVGGNLGDQALTLATKTILKDIYLIEMPASYMPVYCKNMKVLKKIIGKNLILFSAGGYLGTLWFDEIEVYTRELLQSFAENRIIILPQTMFYEKSKWGNSEQEKSKKIYNSCDKLTIYSREQISYNLMKDLYNDVRLMPDLVMFLKFNLPDINRENALMVLRNDCEKTLNPADKQQIYDILEQEFGYVAYSDMVVQGMISPKKRKEAVLRKIEQFAKSQFIVTDRLHGMVFAAIAGTPCAVLKSKSYKLEGCYEWISELDYIRFVNSAEDLICFIRETYNRKYQYHNDPSDSSLHS